MSGKIEIDGCEINATSICNSWAMVLMSRGVIVSLKISKCPMDTGLSSDMLGIKFADEEAYDFFKRYLTLGRHKLLPPQVIKEITMVEAEARRILAQYSFSTGWGHFVPYKSFSSWEKENAKVKEKFIKLSIELGNRYDMIVEEVRDEYKKLARDVWFRLYPENKSEPTQAFVETFVDRIVGKMKSREDIVASFKYEIDYFTIPMPSFIEEDIANAERIKRMSEKEKYEYELEKQTKKKISEEYAKRQTELIDGFLESTVLHMRKYVSDICNGVLKSIAKKKSINRLTVENVNRIHAMIEKVKVLNFYDDIEISELISDLELDLDKIRSEIDHDTIVRRLKKISQASNKKFVVKDFNPSISMLEPL